MKVRFVGNVTVKGVSYADQEEGVVSESSGKYLISVGSAEEVKDAEEAPKTEVVAKVARKIFQRNK